MPVFYWIGFIFLIFAFIGLDLFVFHRKAKEIKVNEALYFSIFWFLFTLFFTLIIYFIYEHGNFSSSSFLYPKSGGKASLQFFTAYFLEKALSLDNLFVIYLIFSYHGIPLKYQHRVLTIGILSASLFRAIFIFFGLALISLFSWMFYVFGIILIFAGLHLLVRKEVLRTTKENLAVKIARLFFKTTSQLEKDQFFVKKNHSWMMTPLFLALLQVETADIIFALDSIPAVFAISLDPFIVFTSNMCAIFGLRSLYFVLTPLIQKFRYLHVALSLMIIYIGIKMMTHSYYTIPTFVSFLILLFLFVGSIFLSLLFPKKAKTEPEFPLQNELVYFYSLTMKQARRIVILVLGFTVLLIGVALIFLPGPAFLVIPIGILILSTEFLWAKRFLKKIKDFTMKK